MNGRVLNNVKENLLVSLKNDILAYYIKGNYFKYAKRLFAFAKVKHDIHLAELLTVILNSELGRLYLLKSDIDTLDYLIENQQKLDTSRIKHEIERFKVRLGTIYSIKSLEAHETELLNLLADLKSLPIHGEPFHTRLLKVGEQIDSALQKATREDLKEARLFPIPPRFQP